VGNPLQELIRFGQSFWYDNIRRELLTGGGLKRMVAEDGLRGLTSNPTIFDKAISGSADYDESLRRHAHLPAKELFLEIELEDIGAAADVLRGVYDGSEGRDGFVSIELTPDLARDAQASIQQAQWLWGRLQRPNVMVKVPATPEGIPVVRRLLADGINVNITLLFDLPSYEKVLDAWLSALEDRAKQGLPLDRIASVASLFVSRVDVKVDKLLAARAAAAPERKQEFEALLGQSGIANARHMYSVFREMARSERFRKLAAQGARPQRLLWASTSTKNPKYPDIYYADALIGPDTVDTMPDVTIAAFRDHGHPADRLTGSESEAQRVLKALSAAGIDLQSALLELREEGVASFDKSYRDLLAGIQAKLAQLEVRTA
jgi:transaldolase